MAWILCNTEDKYGESFQGEYETESEALDAINKTSDDILDQFLTYIHGDQKPIIKNIREDIQHSLIVMHKDEYEKLLTPSSELCCEGGAFSAL